MLAMMGVTEECGYIRKPTGNTNKFIPTKQDPTAKESQKSPEL